MFFSVSRHAMWGFKVSYDENETYTCKELNKCNEFINSEIHDWIKKNGLDKYRERNPPKFCVHMINSETIVIGERIR